MTSSRNRASAVANMVRLDQQDREEQIVAQVCVLSCEVSLKATKLGIVRYLKNHRFKQKSKYEWDHERVRDFRVGPPPRAKVETEVERSEAVSKAEAEAERLEAATKAEAEFATKQTAAQAAPHYGGEVGSKTVKKAASKTVKKKKPADDLTMYQRRHPTSPAVQLPVAIAELGGPGIPSSNRLAVPLPVSSSSDPPSTAATTAQTILPRLPAASVNSDSSASGTTTIVSLLSRFLPRLR
ncbi:hypothetical protein B484DRAFT_460157 [Ochromonadaceae sp. CCMP2298]|nr:hypothetical protein B484DRAFT_460157 [Ochromonadaceae sp. CCMP2298]|mmetsp:Transcript_26502/g.58704  ORF Transcript_26502/g.58704 Transcript_26502/m.58704 type:complete len:240 (+) Transcript_26502:134-853(+)